MKKSPYLHLILLVIVQFIDIDLNSLLAQKTAKKIVQDRVVGGRCEGCEFYSIDMPKNLNWQTTIPQANEAGEKLIIEGYIYQKDGVTPASDIIVYLYHTTKEGYYSPSPHQKSDVKRHGRLRGWVKSRSDGFYSFTTIRPGPYPNASIPAHIHPTIKEEGKTPYYIDDYVFKDDVFVNAAYIKNQELRCGSGIIELTKDNNGVWHGQRNLILGLNIPNY